MNMCPSNKRKLPPELCLKGQVFFIWSNYQSFEIVKDKISLLGGKVDIFLSKDVTTVLVEDNHLCGPQLISNDLTVNSSFAPNAVILSNFQYQSGLPNLPSTSRGFNLLASSSANSPYRIIGYARQWGIQVLGIFHFLSLIEQQVKSAIYLKKKTLENVSNLSGCFIKFESCLKKYRPCYKMFNNDPERLMPLKNAKLLVKPDTCNVILEKPIPSKHHFNNYMDTNERRPHRINECNVNATVKGADKKAQPINKVKPKEENNYCECCKIHFSDLKQHIKSSKHQNFVSNEKNYESVHSILKMLPSAQEFIEKHQTPEINAAAVFSNGEGFIQDNSPEIASAIDYSIPLNLQRKKNDEHAALPLNLHVTKQDVSIPIDLHAKQIEEAAVPLNLHIKKEYDLEKDELIKKEKESFMPEADELNPFFHNEVNVIQQKDHSPNDDLLVTVKLNNKDEAISSEMPTVDTANMDPLFDKTNTAALAQLCLKNFDSYWLDNIPCEMDDLIFDDNIFDIDDGKSKAGNDQTDCLVSVVEDSPATTDIQTPAMVSGISNVCLKTQSSTNTSLFFNCSPSNEEVSVKNEPDNLCESYQSSCKLENCVKSVSPQNLSVTFNELPIDENKKVEKEDVDFKSSISTFYSEKPPTDAIPSCSTTKPLKLAEQMFSSDSSDDENGNVLISNVLNIITYSDTEAKDKDSCNEESDDSKKSTEIDVKKQVCLKTCVAETSNVPSKQSVSASNEQSSESKTPSPYNELSKSKGHAPYDLISNPKDHKSHNTISEIVDHSSYDLTSDSKVRATYDQFCDANAHASCDQLAETKFFAPYKQPSKSKTFTSFDSTSKLKECASHGQLSESKNCGSTRRPSKPKFQFAYNERRKSDSYQFSETETYVSDEKLPKSKSKVINIESMESESHTSYDQSSEAKADAACSAQSKSKCSASFIQMSESKDQVCHDELSKSQVQTIFDQSTESNVHVLHDQPFKSKVKTLYNQSSEYKNDTPYSFIPETKVQPTYNEPMDSKVHIPYNQQSKSKTKSFNNRFPDSKVNEPYIQHSDSKFLSSGDQLQKAETQIAYDQPVELKVYPPNEKVEAKISSPYIQLPKKEAQLNYSQENETKIPVNYHISTSKTKSCLDQLPDSKASVSYDQLSKAETEAVYNQQVDSKVCATFDHISSSKTKISYDQLSEYKTQPSFHSVSSAKIETMYSEPTSSKINTSYNRSPKSKVQPNIISPIDMKVHAPYDHLPKAKAKSIYNQLTDSKSPVSYDQQPKPIVQTTYDQPTQSKVHKPYQPSKLRAKSSHGKFSKSVAHESFRAPESTVCPIYDESKFLTSQEQPFKLKSKSSYDKFIPNAHTSYVPNSKIHTSYNQAFESKLPLSLDPVSKSKLPLSVDQSVRSNDLTSYDHLSESKDLIAYGHASYANAQASNSPGYKMKSSDVPDKFKNLPPKKSMSYTVENMSKSSVSSSENTTLHISEAASLVLPPLLSNVSYATETTPRIVSQPFNSHVVTSISSSETLPFAENCIPNVSKASSCMTMPLQMNSASHSSQGITSATDVCNTQTIAHRTEYVADTMTENSSAVKSVHAAESSHTSQSTVQSVRTVSSATCINQSSKPNVFSKKAEILKFKTIALDEKNVLLPQSNDFAETATPCSVPPISFKGKKLRRKKSMKRLRKLPPLWSVNIMPGTGVRLKFSCVHPQAIESEDGESDFSD